ncbi:MAG TPA: helix-turn-helix transcriptional regulator [Candidatus Excrementavichristensenella intestinipullorum]|nr:helix-turn-helix transcriptional regulator [Candidatus Excrementavichristensenella intestinipullorum]
MSRFHENLRALRESRGLTQESLGNRLGVAKSTVSMYESGNREPSFEMVESIADFFNVPLSTLMDSAPAAPGLSSDELGLLADYRALPPAGKRYLRQSARLARCLDPVDWEK